MTLREGYPECTAPEQTNALKGRPLRILPQAYRSAWTPSPLGGSRTTPNTRWTPSECNRRSLQLWQLSERCTNWVAGLGQRRYIRYPQ